MRWCSFKTDWRIFLAIGKLSSWAIKSDAKWSPDRTPNLFIYNPKHIIILKPIRKQLNQVYLQVKSIKGWLEVEWFLQ